MIISAFPGCGKTILAKKYDNIIDLESTKYLYELTTLQKEMDLEELKGCKKNPNLNWPDNYIYEIQKQDKAYKIVLITQYPEVTKKLEEKNIDYYICFPEDSLKEEYIKRYEKRGNKEEFILRMKENFDLYCARAKNTKGKKIVLKQGEFLEDYLINKMKMHLIERKI